MPKNLVKSRDGEVESNPSVIKKEWRKKALRCYHCPPHKFENAKRGSSYQCKSWKHKTKRKHQFTSTD